MELRLTAVAAIVVGSLIAFAVGIDPLTVLGYVALGVGALIAGAVARANLENLVARI
jgi:hypothetical protein